MINLFLLHSMNGLSILAGTNTLSKGGEKRQVIKSIYHERYGDFKYDIALMRLDDPLEFSDAIKPIEIFTEQVPVDSPVIISGWGKNETWGRPTEQMKFNTLVAISDEECADKTDIAFEGLICLGHSKNNGACNVSWEIFIKLRS